MVELIQGSGEGDIVISWVYIGKVTLPGQTLAEIHIALCICVVVIGLVKCHVLRRRTEGYGAWSTTLWGHSSNWS